MFGTTHDRDHEDAHTTHSVTFTWDNASDAEAFQEAMHSLRTRGWGPGKPAHVKVLMERALPWAGRVLAHVHRTRLQDSRR